MPADILTGPRLRLPDVTLVAATSVAISPTAAAVVRSLAQVEFGAALWLSDQPPPDVIADRVEWRPIARLNSRRDYSRFMLRDLADHIATSHVLCVQWDGFVLNAATWHPDFMDYDYIGAPWPHFGDVYSVGNGGFSLRSRKLLEACAGMAIDSDKAEDLMICRVWRPMLEREFGIRFAPSDLASRFAYERIPASGNTFGFHGVFNLVELINTDRLSEMVDQFETHLLEPKEHREVLIWALRNRRWRLAWQFLRRIARRSRTRT